jgi:pimeloyl-ACP methyl ester carboxylesterase
MALPRDRRTQIALGLAAAGTGFTAAQLIHARRIARDPASAVLNDPPTGTRHEIVSADGTRLLAEEFGGDHGDHADHGAPPAGDGTGTATNNNADPVTFVLAHGWTENRTYWIHQIRALTADGHRVVAFDLRGHGDSAAAGDDYSIARFGEDLEAVLAACAPTPGRTIVAGHSLGAMTIVAWAEQHDVTARIAAAALLNTGVGDLIAESLLIPVPTVAKALNKTIATRGFLGSRAPLPRFSSPVSHAMIRYAAFGPTATPAQIAFYERMLIASPPDARASIGIALSELELHEALPNLDVPTTVIAGAADRLTPPSHAKRIAEMLPQLEQLIVLPDTGHMGPLERPDEVTGALRDLVGRVLAGSGAVAV